MPCRSRYNDLLSRLPSYMVKKNIYLHYFTPRLNLSLSLIENYVEACLVLWVIELPSPKKR